MANLSVRTVPVRGRVVIMQSMAHMPISGTPAAWTSA